MATKEIQTEELLINFDDVTGDVEDVFQLYMPEDWPSHKNDEIAQEAVDDWMSIHCPEAWARIVTDRERIEKAKRDGIGCMRCDYTGHVDRDVRTDNGSVAVSAECECMARRRVKAVASFHNSIFNSMFGKGTK